MPQGNIEEAQMRIVIFAAVAVLFTTTTAFAQDAGITRLGDLVGPSAATGQVSAPVVQATVTAPAPQPIVMDQRGPCTFSGFRVDGTAIVSGSCSTEQLAAIAGWRQTPPVSAEQRDQSPRVAEARAMVDVVTDANRKEAVTGIIADAGHLFLGAVACEASRYACGYRGGYYRDQYTRPRW